MLLSAVRTGALIQARLGSSRLPGKHLLDIDGEPALHRLLSRVGRVVDAEAVVVCTTNLSEDDGLAEAVTRWGFPVFRGHPVDIIDRFYCAVEEFGFDQVIQVDGDDVLVDPSHLSLCAAALADDPAVDVALCEGLPLGMAGKAMRADAIRRVHDRYIPGDNSTGNSRYFTDDHLCRSKIVKAAPDLSLEARVTLDYPEDLAFFRALVPLLRDRGRDEVGDVVAVLRQRPEIVQINAGLDREYWARWQGLVASEDLRYRMSDGTTRRVQS